MAKIGTFSRNPDGSFVGEVVTLSVQASNVRIVPIDGPIAGAPNHRVTVGSAEIGAGWPSDDNTGVLLVELDDPSFLAPIRATLRASGDETKYDLIWSRPD